ncbi:hypothetical protein M427DRAFT_35054 [Gonapodya prolifera JEL478]|uniref:Uncharacterized protein n=1 Tax=Gonapodya prolifera (strain JEL478) TaxID=1344416 RepID=A0A139A6A1_GONPJ|nr:hypothetical protein M427DRAFT_35054 [Gonapodya prolifera JEL478]|eukprot:KXS11975.1 hypothetical protein M427DRAFT_35054 [Gonapodya prolifera JEL478]
MSQANSPEKPSDSGSEAESETDSKQGDGVDEMGPDSDMQLPGDPQQDAGPAADTPLRTRSSSPAAAGFAKTNETTPGLPPFADLPQLPQDPQDPRRPHDPSQQSFASESSTSPARFPVQEPPSHTSGFSQRPQSFNPSRPPAGAPGYQYPYPGNAFDQNPWQPTQFGYQYPPTHSYYYEQPAQPPYPPTYYGGMYDRPALPPPSMYNRYGMPPQPYHNPMPQPYSGWPNYGGQVPNSDFHYHQTTGYERPPVQFGPQPTYNYPAPPAPFQHNHPGTSSMGSPSSSHDHSGAMPGGSSHSHGLQDPYSPQSVHRPPTAEELEHDERTTPPGQVARGRPLRNPSSTSIQPYEYRMSTNVAEAGKRTLKTGVVSFERDEHGRKVYRCECGTVTSLDATATPSTHLDTFLDIAVGIWAFGHMFVPYLTVEQHLQESITCGDLPRNYTPRGSSPQMGRGRMIPPYTPGVRIAPPESDLIQRSSSLNSLDAEISPTTSPQESTSGIPRSVTAPADLPSTSVNSQRNSRANIRGDPRGSSRVNRRGARRTSGRVKRTVIPTPEDGFESEDTDEGSE